MNSQHPSKRRSALIALPAAIVVEIGAIAIGAGGAVTAAAAFALLFGACHQIRLTRWRRHQPA
jgi:hypothetical protein